MGEEKMASSLGFTNSCTDGKMRPRGDRSKRSTKHVTSDASRPPVSQKKEKPNPATSADMDVQTIMPSPSNEELHPDLVDIYSEDEALDHEGDPRQKPKYKLRFKFGRFPRLVPVE
tara:strand:- start:748 stop:1095 length:348 start_codon:yes stop_codon:yes gene_type:complete